MASRRIEAKCLAIAGVEKPVVFVAALRTPEELRGRWWVILQFYANPLTYLPGAASRPRLLRGPLAGRISGF